MTAVRISPLVLLAVFWSAFVAQAQRFPSEPAAEKENVSHAHRLGPMIANRYDGRCWEINTTKHAIDLADCDPTNARQRFYLDVDGSLTLDLDLDVDVDGKYHLDAFTGQLRRADGEDCLDYHVKSSVISLYRCHEVSGRSINQEFYTPHLVLVSSDAGKDGDARRRYHEVLHKPEGYRGKQWNSDRVWPRPEDWESYTWYDMYQHFECKSYTRDQTRPLPTLKDWNVFQQTYIDVVDADAVFDDPTPPTMGYSVGDWTPPYVAGHTTDGKGRGLFASRDIAKGELVHDGTKSEVSFPSGMAWRRYIFALPRNRACDQIIWTWTKTHPADGKFRVYTAMDISVFVNGGDEDTTNVRPESPTAAREFATREIKKGEELITDYSIYETAWDKVGL